MTRILKISRARPQKDRIEEAANAIRNRGVIVMPTDTVYGMAASVRFPGAIRRIYEIKGREKKKSLVRLVARRKDIGNVVYCSPVIRTLMRDFWPGPLTLVLKRAGGRTAGYRIPGHRVSLAILKRTGPLAVTSVNLSGKRSITSVPEMDGAITDKVDLIVDSGPSTIGVESTVLDVSSVPFRILRKGVLFSKMRTVLHGLTCD